MLQGLRAKYGGMDTELPGAAVHLNSLLCSVIAPTHLGNDEDVHWRLWVDVPKRKNSGGRGWRISMSSTAYSLLRCSHTITRGNVRHGVPHVCIKVPNNAIKPDFPEHRVCGSRISESNGGKQIDGYVCLNARTSSSSYTESQGISLAMILSKMVGSPLSAFSAALKGKNNCWWFRRRHQHDGRAITA